MEKIIEILKRPEVIEVLIIIAALIIAKLDKTNKIVGIIQKLAKALETKKKP